MKSCMTFAVSVRLGGWGDCMKEHRYIEGFAERVDKVLAEQGKSKVQIARETGFDRKTFMAIGRENRMPCPLAIARFCAETHTDANWLLGLTYERGKK